MNSRFEILNSDIGNFFQTDGIKNKIQFILIEGSEYLIQNVSITDLKIDGKLIKLEYSTNCTFRDVYFSGNPIKYFIVRKNSILTLENSTIDGNAT